MSDNQINFNWLSSAPGNEALNLSELPPGKHYFQLEDVSDDKCNSVTITARQKRTSTTS